MLSDARRVDDLQTVESLTKLVVSRCLMGRIVKLQLLFALLASSPVLAQGGWAAYADQEFEISGVVESPVSPVGRHATMKIRDDGGQVWDITLTPPAGIATARVREMAFPVDARVTIHGHRHRDPKLFEVKTERITYNRRVYNIYPTSADHLFLNGVYYSRIIR